MKRIVVLIDGTWNKEGIDADTNVAKLDPGNHKILTGLIKVSATDGTEQKTFYHPGVGTDGGLVEHILGGALGLGLKKIVQEAYEFIVKTFASGDEVYILGFSRGAFAARALAGLIGASGIQRQRNDATFKVAWSHYRRKPAAGAGTKTGDDPQYRDLFARNAFHEVRSIKLVGVWETVGSYGVPTGFGLAPLARYITYAFLGFRDTRFGNHIDVGLHAVGIDERRRPFVPTFWTIPKGEQPRGHVEQVWFPGVHCNVGGSYLDAGLSDRALIWMISRIQALTGLEFDIPAVRANTKPCLTGEIYDSSKGWWVSKLWPHLRIVLSPDAIHHGIFFNTRRPRDEHINEKVHWSVIDKRGKCCTVFGVPNVPYNPPNLPAVIPPERIVGSTLEEQALS
jgi:uncharacterized protein (DUF2235 family)